MSEFFYDAQIKRFLIQFMKAMSNFYWQDSQGNLNRIPVSYGDPSQQVASVIAQNSENTLPTTPMIACSIKSVEYDRTRLQSPTHVGKINLRELAVDPVTGLRIPATQGSNYTIERLMPAPYNISMNADVWTSNTEQKLQIWEQLSVLFNPSLEIQSTTNFVDWTGLSRIELLGTDWTNRQAPKTGSNIDIATWRFQCPVWISPPAKVKQLDIITKIISSIFVHDNPLQQINPGDIIDWGTPTNIRANTFGDYRLVVLSQQAVLLSVEAKPDFSKVTTVQDVINQVPVETWLAPLDLYPGKFQAGISQVSFSPSFGGPSTIAKLSLSPTTNYIMDLNINPDSIPVNNQYTLGSITRGTFEYLTDPHTQAPNSKSTDTRIIITETLNPGGTGGAAWQNSDMTFTTAPVNSLIGWDGTKWVILVTPTSSDSLYLTNSLTGVQYHWDGASWAKTIDGVYTPELWSLTL